MCLPSARCRPVPSRWPPWFGLWTTPPTCVKPVPRRPGRRDLERPGSPLELGSPIREVRLVSRAGSTGFLSGTRATLTVDSVIVSAAEDRPAAEGDVPHVHYTNESVLTLSDSTFSGLGRRQGDAPGQGTRQPGCTSGAAVSWPFRQLPSVPASRLVTNKYLAVTIRDSRFVDNRDAGPVVRDARNASLSGVA